MHGVDGRLGPSHTPGSSCEDTHHRASIYPGHRLVHGTDGRVARPTARAERNRRKLPGDGPTGDVPFEFRTASYPCTGRRPHPERVVSRARLRRARTSAPKAPAAFLRKPPRQTIRGRSHRGLPVRARRSRPRPHPRGRHLREPPYAGNGSPPPDPIQARPDRHPHWVIAPALPRSGRRVTIGDGPVSEQSVQVSGLNNLESADLDEALEAASKNRGRTSASWS
jgi:hypothetical protein